MRVDLVQDLACVRIEKAHGLRKELFLVVLGSGAAMGAVPQVGEVAQQFGDVSGLRSGHDLVSLISLGQRGTAPCRCAFVRRLPPRG